MVDNFPGFPEGIDGFELMTRMQQLAEKIGTRTWMGSIVEAVEFSDWKISLTGGCRIAGH
jgi:thioredoxin reductase (NADPH)